MLLYIIADQQHFDTSLECRSDEREQKSFDKPLLGSPSFLVWHKGRDDLDADHVMVVNGCAPQWNLLSFSLYGYQPHMYLHILSTSDDCYSSARKCRLASSCPNYLSNQLESRISISKYWLSPPSYLTLGWAVRRRRMLIWSNTAEMAACNKGDAHNRKASCHFTHDLV